MIRSVSAIAREIADLKALQELLIANEQKFLAIAGGDAQIRDRLNDFLRDDR